MSTQTTTYTTPGSSTYTAPSTLLNGSVTVTVDGAPGQAISGVAGGKGGRVQGSLPLSPSATLTAVVGDDGSNGEHTGGAGYTQNSLDGGHGGGSSALVQSSSVVVEGGGGGGAGASTGPALGGQGGYGGLSPSNGSRGSYTTEDLSGPGSGGGGGGNQGNGSPGTIFDEFGDYGDGGIAPGGGGMSGGVASGTYAGGGGAGGKSYASSALLSPTFSDGAASSAQVQIVATVADAPLAPTLTSPANGAYLDSNAAGVTFEWTYNPGTDSGTETGYALRVSTDGGAYQYWNATSGAFQSSIVWNATTASTVTIPAGKLADGHSYTWSVATQESHYSLQGPFASDLQFTGSAQPTVTVTAPSGTISVSTPTVSWTEVLGSGDAQTAYRALIYTKTVTEQAGFSPGSTTPTVDSGLTSGTATSWTVPSALTAGDWVAYVQITETGGVTSAWASSAFTIAYTGPSAPALTLTAGNDATTGAPTVTALIDGTGCFDPGGGITLSDPTASLERSVDGGVTWTAVRDGTDVAVPTSTYQVDIVDWETPFGVATLYRATLGATTSSPAGVLVTSAPTDATISVVASQGWLTDPLDTTTALALHRLGNVGVLTTLQTPISFQKNRTEQMGVFRAFGRPNAIVQRGTVEADTFTLNVWVQGYADEATFEALANSGHTLLVRTDMAEAFYVVLGPDLPRSVLRATGRTSDPDYVISVTATVTDAP